MIEIGYSNDEIKEQFTKLLDKQGWVVTTGGVKYDELFYLDYVLSDEDEFYDSPARTAADIIERQNLYTEFGKHLVKLQNDLGSRQFVICLDYDGDKDLAGCISLLQVVVRNDKIYMFVFMRSQHIENVEYDNNTFLLLMEQCKTYLGLKCGNINVHVTSLHRYQK